MGADYEEIGAAVGRLVNKKNWAYGDSFHRSGEIIEILYPGGIGGKQVKGMLATIRIIDKMFRIATDKDAMGEDPWRDIAGYALLMCRDMRDVGLWEPDAESLSASKISTERP